MQKLLNIPLPKKNKLAKDNEHLCTELSKNLPEWLTGLQKDIDLAIKTPWALRNILKERKPYALRTN